eukprot:5288066-Amphidinium_carterae.1
MEPVGRGRLHGAIDAANRHRDTGSRQQTERHASCNESVCSGIGVSLVSVMNEMTRVVSLTGTAIKIAQVEKYEDQQETCDILRPASWQNT